MRERRRIVELWRRGGAVALVTLVRVEGSSYRQVGARLLVAGNGEYAGSISGGVWRPRWCGRLSGWCGTVRWWSGTRRCSTTRRRFRMGGLWRDGGAAGGACRDGGV